MCLCYSYVNLSSHIGLFVHFRSFRQLALVYTVAYVAAAVSDHASTLFFSSRGVSEGNILFVAADGGFAANRAILVMFAIWPITIWLLHVGWNRAKDSDKPATQWSRWLTGRTAISALLIPFTLVIGKILAAMFNTVDTVFSLELTALIRKFLATFGVGPPGSGVMIVAIIILAVSYCLARSIARRVVDGISGARQLNQRQETA
jgi:hypothetical protein